MYLLLLATIISWFPSPIAIFLTLSYLESLSVSNRKLLDMTYKEFYSQVIWTNPEDPSFYSSHLRFQGADYDSSIQVEVHLSVLPEWDQCHKGSDQSSIPCTLLGQTPPPPESLLSFFCLHDFSVRWRNMGCPQAIQYSAQMSPLQKSHSLLPSWSNSLLLAILAPHLFPSWHFSVEVVMIYLFAF